MSYEPIATVGEISAGESLSVFVDDTPALLIRVGDDYYVIEDVCTHDGQPLTDGPVNGTEIICTRHGARFDVTTGEPLCMPATKPVQTFAVKIEGDQIMAAPRDAVADETPSASGTPVAFDAGDAAESEASGELADMSGVQVESSGDGPPAEEVIEALREVIDPELMVNIVDLGLIYEVDIDGPKVSVQMTLTSPTCPAGPQLLQQSKMALERHPKVDEADLQLVMSPPWSPERMTDEARDQLGIF